MAVLAVVALVGATVGWAVIAADPDPAVLDLGTVEEGLDELLAYVEEARDLEFKERPVVEALAEPAYEQRVREDFSEDIDEDRQSLQEASDFYAALGLIDPDIDIVEVLEDFFSAATLGFYDPESDELVVRGDRLTPGLQVTIVHELVHALDDQWFDLDRPELDEREDELGFTFSALSEGDARRIEQGFIASMDSSRRAAYFAEQAAALPDLDLSAIPRVLLLEEDLLYLEGAEFAGAVAREGGNEAVDAAFEDPPMTTEEIIEPEVFLAGQKVIEVPDPTADGSVVDQGVAGQFVLDLLTVGSAGGGPEWTGDRYVQWEDAGTRCVAIRFADPDSSVAEALRPWAATSVDRTVVAEDRTALLTGCR